MNCRFGFAQRALLMVLAGGWCVVASGADKPNFIIIMSDDAAYSDFGFSAALNNRTTLHETPNLDALAQQSVVASQAYTAHSLCSPTRAGLLTGQYQQRYGFEDNPSNTITNPQGFVPEQITIAQRLKPLGYTTGIVGKWHLGFIDGLNRPLDKGFDEFYGLLGGGRSYFADNSPHGRMYKGDQLYETQFRQEGDPSKYDPVKGRYVTDAFGEESVDFINRHAGEENPFFLYLPFTSPHTPQEAKQVDLDHFAHIADPTARNIAAITYAMDRSIGEVLDALEANNIEDNTYVIFTNDNGATSYVHNPPFNGHKGTTWEGGIRVPFMIKGPDLDPGVYNSPLTFFDILPTFVNAAGGDVSQIPHDGYDVLPYLKGDAADDPNKARFWRSLDKWAVRKGDWKLASPYTNFTGILLYNIATNPGENISYYNSRPDIVADLLRELTHWEATMAKPKWGPMGLENLNLFDHFVFRADQATSINWSVASSWQKAGTATNVSLLPSDAYANAVLEFGVRDDSDYTATNDMKRWSKQSFMLNQLRFTGNFASAANRQATINGNSLLFVTSLASELPRIRLDATANAAAEFTFNIQNELQLLHDLEITGNGTQNFIISGAIRDYYEPLQAQITTPHNVRKSGTSAVTLTGNNTFAGRLTVAQGSVTVSSASAAINGAEGIRVEDSGTFKLQSGLVAVDWIDNSHGGSFQFNGGTLKVVDIAGDLVNNGGTYSPGSSPALSTVSGNLSQAAGTLLIEIGGASAGEYDSVLVGGAATIGATLDIDLVSGFVPTPGQVFKFLLAEDGIVGTFANSLLPSLPSGRTWHMLCNANAAALIVAPAAGLGGVLPGDYNEDGIVDAADYTVWRDAISTGNLNADGNFDNQVTTADYTIWKSAFGLTYNGSGSLALTTVPEPATACILLLATMLTLPLRLARSRHIS